MAVAKASGWPPCRFLENRGYGFRARCYASPRNDEAEAAVGSNRPSLRLPPGTRGLYPHFSRTPPPRKTRMPRLSPAILLSGALLAAGAAFAQQIELGANADLGGRR